MKNGKMKKMAELFEVDRTDVNKHLRNIFNKGELDLEKILNEYSPYITTIINNIAKDILNSEDKEEIVSEVFFILCKNKKFF